jgi:hypothetical protein
MTFEEGEDVATGARDLAANTLAYHLADRVDRERLVDLFGRIAQTIAERTDGPHRLLIRHSPLPPSASAELQAWLMGNIEVLHVAVAEDRLLDVVSSVILEHTNARSISNLSDAGLDVVPAALAEWVAGHSYAAIHALLRARDVRVSGDRATVEDAVALCENGFGYDVAMVVATLADLAEPVDQDVYRALALLQRRVKHGLTDRAALAFLEAGFADRVVASALAAPWPEVRDRRDVRAVCRSRPAEVAAILAAYPSYFTIVATELGR